MVTDRTQVDEASFRSTKANLPAALKDNIRDKFDIDWTQTQYEDLSKPLHSGIAAMLKIAKHYDSTDIPQSVASQATYWASSYTVNTWTDATYVYTKASNAIANSKYFSFLFSDFSMFISFDALSIARKNYDILTGLHTQTFRRTDGRTDGYGITKTRSA